MKTKDIRNTLNKFHWERWLKRPIEAFMLSLFQKSITRKYMQGAGVDTEYLASVFQDGVWYKSPEVHKIFRSDIEKYLAAGGSIFTVSRSCEKFWADSRKRIAEMQSESVSRLLRNVEEFAYMVNQVNAYVWLTYGFEEIYTDLLREKVRLHIEGDTADFIRRVSVSSKKNSYAEMEEALKSSRTLPSIQKEFGWLKSRDGFTEGFTIRELAGHRKRIRGQKQEAVAHPVTPSPLRELVKKVQELIYFRTLRGDARSNLIFLMRPLLKKVARKYDIPFSKLRCYSVYDLIAGKPKYYPPGGTFLFSQGTMVFSRRPFVKEKKLRNNLIRGHVGSPGVVRGVVRIVTKSADVPKVKNGDIFVSQMTFPAFIVGMRKAAAFVTDEGGITCHAAIIAREMKKPCIVGTKISTQVLKDGDIVEVDAKRGIVRKIS